MPIESERLPRRLAAILYADIAGYSRVTGSDEDGTHQTLSQHLDRVSGAVRTHRGRVMHYAGDAALAVFDAVVDALTCAMEIQRDVAAANSTLPKPRRIEFRIGVNLGDVIEDRGDVYGNGVNVAARLASLAEPGGVCVSESVRVAVGQKLPISYRDIGSQTLKNIAEPVRVYRAVPGAGRSVVAPRRAAFRSRAFVTAVSVVLVGLAIGLGALRWGGNTLSPGHHTDGSSASAAAKLVAVLPFENLSAQSDEYFSDGLTDELINRLARLPGLKVSPRTSSFYFKGKNELPATIAGLLRVRYLLEGTVRLAGDRLRVSVRLIDTDGGDVLWSEPFDHANEDVFAIQDQISLAVVEHLRVTLGDDARSSIKRHATDSPEAQDLVFRAKYLAQAAKLGDVDEAIAYYERATKIDQQYAAAYVGLADALVLRNQLAELPPQDPGQDRARELLRKAIAIDPNAANARALLADLERAAFACDASARELAAAERIDPQSVDVLLNLSRYYNTCDWKPERALDYARRAAEADPFNPWAAIHVPLAYYHRFDFEDAIREYNLLTVRVPGYWLPDWGLWYALDDLGRYDEAFDAVQRAVKQNAFNQTRTCLAVAYARLGKVEEARAIYDELVAAADAGQYWSPSFQAMLLVALGENEKALDALEEAYRIRDGLLTSELHLKNLLPLHGDARFERLVDSLGQRQRLDALAKRLGQL
jgi:class 3 adenylate cyclase/TolB-like protein/Tfp pilus assembly protein PilF